MAKWYQAANEASFKPVAEGYVFQAPNPWIFARPRYYLVNEAQKAEITVRLGRWRLLMMGSFAFIGLFLVFMTQSPATIVWLMGPALHLGIGTLTVLTILLMTLLMAPIIAGPQIYLNRALRPLIADAPLTNERIKMGDQLPKIAASVSGTLLVVGLVGGLGMIGGAILKLLDSFFEGHLARDLLLFLPLLVIGGLLAAYFVYLLRLKAKLKRAAP